MKTFKLKNYKKMNIQTSRKKFSFKKNVSSASLPSSKSLMTKSSLKTSINLKKSMGTINLNKNLKKMNNSFNPLQNINKKYINPFKKEKIVNSLGIHLNNVNKYKYSSQIVQHRDTIDNTKDTPFEWNADSLKEIDQVLAKYPSNYKQSGILPLLYIAQEQKGANNWIPLAAMNKIAETLEVPPIMVYSVATFYTMYNTTKVGKYHIQLCGTTPCQLCGSEKLQDAIYDKYGIRDGETTKDGMFTVWEVECLGACANAPMIQVNNHEFYENLTPETCINVLESLKNGKPVKPGPQNGQIGCEGIQGYKTLLKDVDPFPTYRNIDELLASKDKK